MEYISERIASREFVNIEEIVTVKFGSILFDTQGTSRFGGSGFEMTGEYIYIPVICFYHLGEGLRAETSCGVS